MSVRTIQREAANGRIKGARKIGRFWRLPASATNAPRPRDMQPQPHVSPLQDVVKKARALNVAIDTAQGDTVAGDVYELDQLLVTLERLRAAMNGLGGDVRERRDRAQRKQDLAARRRS